MFVNYLGKRIFVPFYSADGGSGSGGDGGAGDGKEGGSNAGAGDDKSGSGGEGDKKLEFTQEQLDKMIADRLKRAEKQWQQKVEEDKKKEQMTEAEKLKAEKEETEKKAKALQESANQRLTQAEAKIQATALGVKPEKLTYVLKLVDLSMVTVDENGIVDEKAAKAAVEAVLKDLPELKGSSTGGDVGSGSNPGGGNTSLNDEEWGKKQAEERQKQTSTGYNPWAK